MRIELLYFKGCPGYEALLPRLRAIVSEARAGTEIELRQVETIAAAEQERFLGSPTVRVDGVDVDPGAAGRIDFGIKCRLYPSENGFTHVPPASWIATAVRRPMDGGGEL